jgi:hypothetical protein
MVSLSELGRVEAREQVLGVAFGGARRVRDRADVGRGDAPELVTREVLLDLLLQRRRELDPRLLVELDPDHLRIVHRDPDMHARFVALGLEEVAIDRRRQHAKIGDVDACGDQTGDHGPLKHPADGRRLAARDDARVPRQRGP